jgi:SAM-dependent methyltransferase
MFDQYVNSPASGSGVQANLEFPVPGQKIYDEAIFLSGWVYASGRDPATCQIRASIDNCCFAETRVLSYRSDVARELGLTRDVPTGFRMLGKIRLVGAEAREATLRVVASWNGDSSSTLVQQSVRLVPALLSQRPHGEVVYPDNEALLRRENIYGSGPPIEEPGVEVTRLLEEYLPDQCSVVDVGCGAGAYGPRLIASGHAWLGLETSSFCCDILRRRQLPFRRVDNESRSLPGGDGEWDCAICIEVLEHVKEPEIFLHEIARVIRRRALISVPNIEVLPYLHDWAVVPWHLLERDHKNFFTRSSLRSLLQKYFRHVEVFPYGEHPLRTRDGIPVHVHFWAIADL